MPTFKALEEYSKLMKTWNTIPGSSDFINAGALHSDLLKMHKNCSFG
jgi:hypothetical protein